MSAAALLAVAAAGVILPVALAVFGADYLAPRNLVAAMVPGHCADASELPGVLFSNRPIDAGAPSLVDVAPSIHAIPEGAGSRVPILIMIPGYLSLGARD